MKAHKKRLTPTQIEILELEENLAQTQVQIAQAYAGFNAVSDGDLVESYVYEIQALRARYSYLLRRRKALETPLPAEASLSQGPAAELPVAERPQVLSVSPALPVA